MKIIVLTTVIPDLIEELEISPDGKSLDKTYLRYIPNELDDHALEEALLLKERHGGEVVVLALNIREETDEMLFAALAKGADKAVKINGDFEGIDNHAKAKILRKVLENFEFDLILTGVQTVEDIDGYVGPLLASYLAIPYVGVVSGVSYLKDTLLVKKELPGGLLTEMEVSIPCVLGIQAAENPPRYVAISRLRQMMRTAKLEEFQCEKEKNGKIEIKKVFKPEIAGKAEMIVGEPEEIVEKIVKILEEKGIIK
jgi:electron transfer flavoprotein beta subunit